MAGYAGQITKVDRKQGRGEVAGQAGLERERAAGRSPDVDVDSRVVERTKETQTLNVVHMEMGEEDVDPRGVRWDLCP